MDEDFTRRNISRWVCRPAFGSDFATFAGKYFVITII